MVAVKGQDHHILDFDKREKWLDTMLAWFTKYLQDDPSWWDDMYPQKQLQNEVRIEMHDYRDALLYKIERRDNFFVTCVVYLAGASAIMR